MERNEDSDRSTDTPADSDRSPDYDPITNESAETDATSSDGQQTAESTSHSAATSESSSQSEEYSGRTAPTPLVAQQIGTTEPDTLHKDVSAVQTSSLQHRDFQVTDSIGRLSETSLMTTSNQVEKPAFETPISEPAAENSPIVATSSEKKQTVIERIATGTTDVRTPEPVTESALQSKHGFDEDATLGTLQETETAQHQLSPSQQMTPDEATTGQRPVQTPAEFDPGYRWGGGTPYATTTPQCIVHIDPSDRHSLPFLQRVLRDTYTELEGGRPRTTTLGTRGGTLESVEVQGQIVTLDLADTAWEVETDGERVQIMHDGTDLLPALQARVRELYGGKLGYLLLNIPVSDVESRFRSAITEDVVAALREQTEPGPESTEEHVEFTTNQTPPVRIARPRHNSPAKFYRTVAQYFAVEDPPAEYPAGVEAAQDSRVHANDWRRIALTDQQDEGAESDEHYLWKATLVDGLAWNMKQQYEHQQDATVKFDWFTEEMLLRNGPITSEAETPPSGVEGIPDLLIEPSTPWAWNATRDFLAETALEPSQETPVALEFETGRGEGAFNLRKLRKTVEKYEQCEQLKLAVVVPPRLLFRSRERAEMAIQLVESQSEDSPLDVALCVPVLGNQGCDRLVAGKTRLESWFGESK